MYVEDRDSLELQGGGQAVPQDSHMAPRQAVILASKATLPRYPRQAAAVQTWVAAYNRGGLDAARTRPHPGGRDPAPRPRRPIPRADDMPPRPEDGACTLRGPEIRRILEQREFFAACYSLDGVSSCCIASTPQQPPAAPPPARGRRRGTPGDLPSGRRSNPGDCRGENLVKRSRSGMRTRPASARQDDPRVWARHAARGRARVRQNGRTSSHSGRLATVEDRRRVDCTGVEYGGGECVPGAVLTSVGLGSSCGVALGWCQYYHVGKSCVGARECKFDQPAAVLAGVEPGGEREHCPRSHYLVGTGCTAGPAATEMCST